MAHWPVGGPDGSLRLPRAGCARRRIFIHVNNTNPLLRDDSPERARGRRRRRGGGATTGMELEL